jgi:hypothetical protein
MMPTVWKRISEKVRSSMYTLIAVVLDVVLELILAVADGRVVFSIASNMRQ